MKLNNIIFIFGPFNYPQISYDIVSLVYRAIFSAGHLSNGQRKMKAINVIRRTHELVTDAIAHMRRKPLHGS